MKPSRERRFTWNKLLWALVFPQRGQRIVPTVSGTLLIALTFGIGTAAYNSANNILFITLSLLVTCLLMSGVLSWLNFRGLEWRIEAAPPLRAGHVTTIGLSLENQKAFLPTYGLWFDVAARIMDEGPPAVAQSTFTGKDVDVRAALAKIDAAEAKGRLRLCERLDPRGTTRLDWIFQPTRRGRLTVELSGVGSLFPFGFLRKTRAAELKEELVVWPAVVEYRRQGAAAERRTAGGERVARAGTGGDLLALRRYAPGDSHRLIHWKASARSGQLLVRQFSAESMEGFALWLQTDAHVWTRPEQFELLVSFCATLAEDLFRNGQLETVALDTEAPVAIRQVRDLERFFDRLAVLQPAAAPGPEASATRLIGSRKNLLTFAPDGTHGVAAFVHGEKAATA